MKDLSNELELTATNNYVRLRMQEIARAEIQRQRRKIDSLTPEQVSVVEELLVATANEISGRINESIQRYPAELRERYLNVWVVQAA
jgi:hypothetical protein